jgi:GNAT superfamily N-acetyltransferase
MRVRAATDGDFESIRDLIGEFVTGHPAANQPRPVDVLRKAYLGAEAVGRVVVAEELRGRLVGFAAWRRDFDMFWGIWGGEGIGLFVRPSHRGVGVALSLVTATCAQIREGGGQYLRACYEGDDLARFYERIAIGRPQRECYLSAAAFERLADLAGHPPRLAVRHLPDKELNFKTRDRQIEEGTG